MLGGEEERRTSCDGDRSDTRWSELQGLVTWTLVWPSLSGQSGPSRLRSLEHHSPNTLSFFLPHLASYHKSLTIQPSFVGTDNSTAHIGASMHRPVVKGSVGLLLESSMHAFPEDKYAERFSRVIPVRSDTLAARLLVACPALQSCPREMHEHNIIIHPTDFTWLR